MDKMDLKKYGITGVTEIVYNPSYDELFREETKKGLRAEKFVVRRIVHDLGHTRDPVLFQIHFVHSNRYF